MSFNDIFKNSFLDKVTEFSIVDTLISIVLAFAIGMFIYFIYKKTYQGVMFNRQFGVSLVALTMIATFIILAVTSNVVLSLGMVGALSIVRFRSAIKDPLDLVFLFWSVGAGIVLGACMYPLAVIGSLIVGVILFIFVRAKVSDSDYILVVECKDEAAEKRAEELIKTDVKKYSVKSKTVARGYIEVSYEVRLNGSDTEFVNKVSSADGIDKAVLVSYNGDYMA
ncbi:MAG: DUF4956 domain-containing protein [Clostridiales bacterium]|nr:DUF4956 domain-containing protein [Clostridia bacterium]MCR4905790.1 DUF4956 domain-containing protein [Clostridiales bacterium]